MVTLVGSGRKEAAMQVLVALVALPTVAVLLALASRLEDGLRAAAGSDPPPALDPLPSGSAPLEPDLSPASPGD
jgi:hypothetical protein